MEKWIQYAAIIHDKIIEMVGDEDSEINISELSKEENLKAFFHALSNAVPAQLFNKWTKDDKNFLEFNHVANQLCFEYSTLEK